MTMTTMMMTMMINHKASDAMRHELKHQINLREDLVLSQRLRKIFPHDKNAGADGTYKVTSLYFDTPYDDALREKLNGVNRREKFRLRYYGDDISFIRVEKKYKENGLCGKRSALLTPTQVQKLISGEYEFLLDTEESLLAEIYSKLQGKALRPKTVVSYSREAFCYDPGNVRITLDRNVGAAFNVAEFLNPTASCLNVLGDVTVLEVKYDRFLPEIVRMAVQVDGRKSMACSKYALCRQWD